MCWSIGKMCLFRYFRVPVKVNKVDSSMIHVKFDDGSLAKIFYASSEFHHVLFSKVSFININYWTQFWLSKSIEKSEQHKVSSCLSFWSKSFRKANTDITIFSQKKFAIHCQNMELFGAFENMIVFLY